MAGFLFLVSFLIAVVGMFNQTNRLANGYQIEVDEQYISTG